MRTLMRVMELYGVAFQLNKLTNLRKKNPSILLKDHLLIFAVESKIHFLTVVRFRGVIITYHCMRKNA